MSLSDKIMYSGYACIKEKDVKQFIKELKEWGWEMRKSNEIFRIGADDLNTAWEEQIDRLAGDKLI